jgi:hypothetical protein
MTRARQLHEGHQEYCRQVAGPDGANEHAALETISILVGHTVKFPDTSVPGLVRELKRIFPQKAAHSGEEGLARLVERGVGAARSAGFETPEQQALVVILMFVLGHGCIEDPFYPWIAEALGGGTAADGAGAAGWVGAEERREAAALRNTAERARRLKEQTADWLDRQLAEAGVPA